MNEPTILAELKERRDKVLNDLREREPDVAKKLIQLNAAISGIEAESGDVREDDYSGFRKPSEAIFGYLDIVKKPQKRDEMCRALVNGGYGDGKESHYWILIRMVNYQVDKERLVERNGLIGKPDWPRALFEAEK